ncbi:hypothetical protein BCR34DRAFT_263784 [Clohesyomyces aquaticus]|uniref:Uncharacterized protein n=1 Tax=Clohesyomyces aquaticus TaxID=1231657 RepID=A0A1Y1ZTC0_9PLEO|nr:hypothetical protein BCR34DRAFT_263784 [Clohesyomyces aquaticus]
MSTLRMLVAKRSPFAGARIAQRAAYHGTAVRYAGKESALGQEGRHDEIEAEKQDSLSKQKAGKGHWKGELASDSESIVKADRGEVEASEETIKKLQDEAVKASQQKK